MKKDDSEEKKQIWKKGNHDKDILEKVKKHLKR